MIGMGGGFYIYGIPYAIYVPFDNRFNGFISKDVQRAIEETRISAEGLPRAGCRSTYNSTISANQWLGPSELLSNTPLLKIPIKIRLNEISWANQNINVSFQIEFYKNGKLATDKFYTMTVVSPNDGTGYVDINSLNFTFNAGDVIRAKYRDWETDRKSTRLNSSHSAKSRMPSSA